MINNYDIKQQFGQFFILGFPGREPSDEFLTFINRNRIGGVIFFKDNCPDHSTVQSNIKLIKDAISNPIIAVDQEGGRVMRVTGEDVELMGASEYGDKLGLEKFKADYDKSIKNLKSLGFNLNLAPVCDIFLNNENVCLKGRCFGSTAEAVAPFVFEAVSITNKNNILSCLKHFPGLGESQIDPHISTAHSNYDLETWNKRERIPFEAGIEAGANMIMTTHLQLSSFDKEIVTGSKQIINSLLRDKLNFNKIIITDDLLMKGASILGDIEQRAVFAFNAGHDILLFGQDFDKAKEAFENFRNVVTDETINTERIKNSLDRIAELKEKLN